MSLFTLCGQVREKETGIGVPGLIIKAYDKDLLFDDLLGNTRTDANGEFELSYAEGDFQEFFATGPDIYLEILTPFHELLHHTRDAIRCDAGRIERFELALDRATLGQHAPAARSGSVLGRLQLGADQLELTKAGEFDLPRHPNFYLGGQPGDPAILEQIHKVIIPHGAEIRELVVDPGEPLEIGRDLHPLPVQQPYPVLPVERDELGAPAPAEQLVVDFTPPNPDKYDSDRPYPENLVEQAAIRQTAYFQELSLRVRPLRYDPVSRVYRYFPNLKYRISHDPDSTSRTIEAWRAANVTIGRHQLQILGHYLRGCCFHNPNPPVPLPPVVAEKFPHVIITDDYQWPESVSQADGTRRPPATSDRGPALTGSMSGEFEALAKWKTSRGIRSRVVLISDIIAGSFGDMTQNGFARDLQEVIRNFIKQIARDWGTSYVLLAGKHRVLPWRKLVSFSSQGTVGGMLKSSDPMPKKGWYYHDANRNLVKIHALLEYGHAASPFTPLMLERSGQSIPYYAKASGTRPGWYYTTEQDFQTLQQGFTRLPSGRRTGYVIVEGPKNLIDGPLYWVVQGNAIPSDLYYSSLFGSAYDTGRHDFDQTDDGLYGTLAKQDGRYYFPDGVEIFADVIVGRAPVDSGAEAKGFAHKVITYESLGHATGVAVDPGYLARTLFAAGHFVYFVNHVLDSQNASPNKGRYAYVTGQNESRIHVADAIRLKLTANHPNYYLLSRYGSPLAIELIPYNPNAGQNDPGWFFATDDTYQAKSTGATRFLVVRHAKPEVLKPASFVFNLYGIDSWAREKETIRKLFPGWFPSFRTQDRYYDEFHEFAAPPPIDKITPDTIDHALNQGQHLVSLSGHGSPSGCCGINVARPPLPEHPHHYSIMFADSCETAWPDLNNGEDSMAEALTKHPDGGCVAYVGSTRTSWEGGPGHRYERFFWHYTALTGRPGLAASFRTGWGNQLNHWMAYSYNYFGDPEMRAWTREPIEIDVKHTMLAKGGDTVTIQVTPVSFGRVTSDMDDTRVVPGPGQHTLGLLPGLQVTLLGGWSRSGRAPRLFLTKEANPQGRVSFRLPNIDLTAIGKIKVTVDGQDVVPYLGEITPTSV